MPIVKWYTPGQLVGDLAQNAGNFATQQQNYENSVQERHLGLQAEAQRQRFAADEARAEEEKQWHQSQQQNQNEMQDKRIAGQASLTKMKDADRLDQIAAQMEAQGANAEHVTQLRNEAAQKRADARNTTTERGQDLRHGDAQGATNQKYYNTDTNAETKYYGIEQQNQRAQAANQLHMQLEQERQTGKILPDNTTSLRAHVNTLIRSRDSISKAMATAYDPAVISKLQAELNDINTHINYFGPILQQRLTAQPQRAVSTMQSQPHPSVDYRYAYPPNSPSDFGESDNAPGEIGPSSVAPVEQLPSASTMADPRLVQFIAQEKAKGTPPATIKAMILQQGGQ